MQKPQWGVEDPSAFLSAEVILAAADWNKRVTVRMNEELIANQPFILENNTIRSSMSTIIVLSPLDMVWPLNLKIVKRKTKSMIVQLKKALLNTG